MLSIFKNQLIKHLHIKDKTTFLCAVSGGMDSMVLLDLMIKSGYSIGVAHVDHNTRAGASTDDALFVATFCAQKNIPFFSKKIKNDELPKGNFQDAARSYRYTFFEDIAEQYAYHHILTAHHKDDRWETFVQHLAKSAGLTGLTSLRYVAGNLVRPLLPFTRQQIEEYAKTNDVSFVHDASNDTDYYMRNKIRHHITPAFESIFDDFINAANRSIHYLEKENNLLEELIHKSSFIKSNGELLRIDCSLLDTYVHKETLLLKLLRKYSFSSSDVLDMLDAHTGALFYTSTHEVLKDRTQLFVRPRQAVTRVNIKINNYGTYTLADGRIISISDNVSDTQSKHSTFFPFTIRTWRAGDHFRPAGMHGKSKKIKDFLTDKKLSRWEKEVTLVAEKESIIFQVIGHRKAEYGQSVPLITLSTDT